MSNGSRCAMCYGMPDMSGEHVPRVSIVTATYDRSNALRCTIATVLAQTVRDCVEEPARGAWRADSACRHQRLRRTGIAFRAPWRRRIVRVHGTSPADAETP
jgi:hypothetical protein